MQLSLARCIKGNVRKRFILQDDGAIAKDTTRKMYLARGEFEILEFDGIGEFAKLLSQFPTDAALCAGVPRNGRRVQEFGKQEERHAGLIARCKDDLEYARQFPLLIDYDGGEIDDPALIWQRFLEIFPEATGAAWCAVPSSSTHIFDPSGVQVKGGGRWHLYVLAAGSVAKMKALYKQRGGGNTFDPMPWHQAALHYEAAPILPMGFTQRKPAPVVVEGTVWELDALPEPPKPEPRPVAIAPVGGDLEQFQTDEIVQFLAGVDFAPNTGTYQSLMAIVNALTNLLGEYEAAAIGESLAPQRPRGAIAKMASSAPRLDNPMGALVNAAKNFGYTPSLEYRRRFAQSQLGRVTALFFRKKRTTTTPKPAPVLTTWEPGADLVNDGSVVTYRPGDRLQCWQAARAQGFKYVLASDGTGGGKSHTAGEYPHREGAREWYLDQSHRNPSTAPIEANYSDLPTRHNGLTIDRDRTTALGNPYRTRTKRGAIPDSPGNCHHADDFLKLQNLGHDVATTGEGNAICRECRFFGLCGRESGPGYGFRRERAIALKNDRIRLSPHQFPHGIDCSQDVAFWEEGGALIQSVDVVTASARDVDKTIADLMTTAPETYAAIAPLLTAVKSITDGHAKTKRYGLNHDELVSQLPTVTPETLAAVVQELEALQVDATELVAERDSVTIEQTGKGISSAARATARAGLAALATQQTRENIEALGANWLLPLLRVLIGGGGAIRANYRTITITTANNRHRAIAGAMGCNIILDATTPKAVLALRLGAHESDILEVREQSPAPDNITIHHITGLGLLTRQRSKSQAAKLAAVQKAIAARHPGESGATIDYKTVKVDGDRIESERYWFRDSRGSNEAQDDSYRIAVGCPFQNLGSLEDEFRSITGSLDGFADFYESHTQGEIIQDIGRLRANRRPGETLHYYACTDYDMDFLKESGFNLVTVPAGSLTIEAADTITKVMTAIVDVAHSGAKITQAAIADAVGVTPGRISQLTTPLGGFKAAAKTLVSLLESPIGKLKFLGCPPEWQQYLTGQWDEFVSWVRDRITGTDADTQSPAVDGTPLTDWPETLRYFIIRALGEPPEPQETPLGLVMARVSEGWRPMWRLAQSTGIGGHKLWDGEQVRWTHAVIA